MNRDYIIEGLLRRIEQLMNHYQMSSRKFAMSIGVNYNTFQNCFRRKSDISHSLLFLILTKYPDVNVEWLMLGRGEMMKENTSLNETTKLLGRTLLENKNLSKENITAEKEIERLQRIIMSMSERIALLNGKEVSSL